MKRLVDKALQYMSAPLARAINDARRPNAATQIQLLLTYRELAREGRPLPSVPEVGFKVYSQTDEDGILLFLFALIGVERKLCVEICAGDGIECNTTNLILNHGWHGFLVDGDQKNVERGKRFFAQAPETYVYPPCFVHAWVTRGTVNQLLAANGFSGEIDLLSLDLDGIDYWLWKAIDIVSPRVVVVEYQDILGPTRACTIPYSDDFSSQSYPTTAGLPNFAGASLAAFVKLARERGYRLVAVNRYGFNAFFVRNGLCDDLLPEVPAAACFTHPKVISGIAQRLPTVAHLPWVEV